MRLLLNLNFSFLFILAGIISSDAYCPAPYMDIGGRCLHLETATSGTWQEMKLFCEELKGKLVKLDSVELLDAIVQFIKREDLPRHDYWTGANDIEEEGKFVFLDGTPVKMGTPLWGTHGEMGSIIQEPDDRDGTQDCVCVYGTGFYYLYDGYCTDVFTAICEFEAQ